MVVVQIWNAIDDLCFCCQCLAAPSLALVVSVGRPARCHRHLGARNPPSLCISCRVCGGLLLQNFLTTKLEGLKLVYSALVLTSETCTSSSLCEPSHGTMPVACCPAQCNRPSAATMPGAKLHSEGQSTSPCSVSRSLGKDATPTCSRKERVRCFQPAAACLGRRPLAEILTAFHTIIPKQFFHLLESC